MPYNIRITAISNYDSKLTTSVFSSIIAVVLALIYCLSRIGFYNPLLPIVYVLSISLLLLNFPIFFRIILLKFNIVLKDTWITSDAFYYIFILLLLVLTGFIVPYLNINPILIIFPIGLIAFFSIFIVWLSSRKISQSLIFISFTGLFSLWVAAIVWNSGYLTPLFFERIIAYGKAHQDPLFHASIAGMIKTYGLPSTGINGLEYISYHYGSHWIFAQLAKLLKLDTLHFYNLAYPIIFIPFFYHIAMLFVIELKNYIHNANYSLDLTTDYIFWLVFLIVQIGFISPKSELITSWSWNNHLLSESYNLSLSFSLLLSILVLLIIPSINKKNKSFLELFLIIVFIPILLAIIGFMKISAIFLLLACFIYLFFRLNLYNQLTYILSLVMTILSFIIVILLTGTRSHGIIFSPFNFFFEFATTRNPFFFIFYFLFSWFFIILKCYERNIANLSDFKNNLLSKKIMDIEMVVLFCLVGGAPGFIVGIPGGATHYFSDFQSLIAISLLLANLYNFSKVLGEKNASGSWGKLKLKYLFAMIIGACILVSIGTNYVKPISQMVKMNIRTRIQLGMDSPPNNSGASILAKVQNPEQNEININSQLRRAVKTGNFDVIKDYLINKLNKRYHNDKRTLLINKLQELGDAVPSEKKRTVLFIPQSNKLYWNLLSCDRMPSLSPAISNLAMIDGLPEINCRGGYFMDHRRQEEQAPVEQIKDEICRKAWAQGFSRIILLDADSEANILVEEWHNGQK